MNQEGIGGELNTFTKIRQMSILETIVGFVLYTRTVKRINRGTQTNEDEQYCLMKRLEMIDDKFTSSTSNIHKNRESPHEIEKLIRSEYESQLKAEMLLFKETELRDLRISIEQNLQEKYTKLIENGKRNITQRLQRLQEREETFMKLMDDKVLEFEGQQQKIRLDKLDDLQDLKTKQEDIARERLARISDLELKNEALILKQKEIFAKEVEVDNLRADLQYERELLDKKRRSKNILKNMEDLAVETARMREEITERQKTESIQHQRIDRYEEENQSLRLQNSNLQKEIRDLLSDLGEVREKLRSTGYINGTLREQGKIFSENEMYLTNNQRRVQEQLIELGKKYEKSLKLNEEIRLQILEDRKKLSQEFEEKEKELKQKQAQFEEDLKNYVLLEKYTKLELEKKAISDKYKKLYALKIDQSINFSSEHIGGNHGDYDPKKQLSLISTMIDTLKSNK